MSLTPTGRRAEAFARLLESGGRSDDPAVGPFVALAEALTAVPALDGPRPEFRAALRQRLVAVATVQGAGASAVSPASRIREAGATWKVQRRMAVLAGSAAAATAIAGVGLGASRSLPGDPFYGVKRTAEDVQLATTFGQEAKGRRHLEFARTRLAEVEALTGQSTAIADAIPGRPGALGALVDQASASTIVDTLKDMDAETRAGADDLFAVYRDTGARGPLDTLDEFTRSQYADLRHVLPALPTDARQHAITSLALLTAVSKQTVDLAGTSATSPEAPAPTDTPATGHGGGTDSPTPEPHQTTAPDSGTGGGSSSSPGTSTNPGGTEPTPEVPNQLPSDAPTIPPVLPSVSPLPTELPSQLPQLPDVPDLPVLGG